MPRRARTPAETQFARSQRRTANEFSATVWQWLRNRQICRQKFRREEAIPPYTVDFCCLELRLIIEIDGKHHNTEEGVEHDRVRDKFLRAQGYEILRIPGFDVIKEESDVLTRIRQFVQTALERRGPSPPAPLPAQRGARGARFSRAPRKN